MLIRALLILAVGFAVLFLARVSAARRRVLMMRWPAAAFAVAAFWELSRGGFELALVCAGLAVLSWFIAPRLLPRSPAENFQADPADTRARAVLGVNASADESEIRRVYRARMAKAHPDKGGTQAQAAQLTAARDQLLRKKR